MSRTFHHGKRNSERNIKIKGVRRRPADTRNLARALIDLAQAEAEAEARAEHQRRGRRATDKDDKSPKDSGEGEAA